MTSSRGRWLTACPRIYSEFWTSCAAEERRCLMTVATWPSPCLKSSCWIISRRDQGSATQNWPFFGCLRRTKRRGQGNTKYLGFRRVTLSGAPSRLDIASMMEANINHGLMCKAGSTAGCSLPLVDLSTRQVREELKQQVQGRMAPMVPCVIHLGREENSCVAQQTQVVLPRS